jgi:hypothetical protein
MAAQDIAVVAGIDTHTDRHQAAVIDSIGRHLATESFETTSEGYGRLPAWLRSHGEVLAVGIEGTGAYGAEIARFLTAHGVTVVEVDRPDRKARRDNGKSDLGLRDRVHFIRSCPAPNCGAACRTSTPGSSQPRVWRLSGSSSLRLKPTDSRLSTPIFPE